MPATDPTIEDVSSWMQNQIETRGWLYQEEAAWTIRKEFGEDFVYTNENGNLAISKQVLAQFRKDTEGAVKWDKGEKAWRRPMPYDGPGRAVE